MNKILPHLGVFLTFEGGEGAGKTTQIKLLQKALIKKGHKVFITREPGGTHISDQIRSILLHPDHHNMVPLCELFLYEAARAQHVEEAILPHLKKKFVVISDRFFDATTVYQGIARKLPSLWIKKLNQLATHGLKPNLTIILDCPVEEGFHRLKQEKRKLDRLEHEKRSFHEKIRQGYIHLSKKESGRIKMIDGTQSHLYIHEKILDLVLKRL